MFIVWGRKIVRRPIGYVADYCGICRDAKPFKLSRLGSAGHVYHISFGEGRLVGHERTCTSCGTFSEANVAAYATVSRAATSLDTLKQETYPGLDAAMAARRELDERIRTAPHLLTPDERLGLIRAPFNLLTRKVEKHFAATHLDAGIGLAFAGAIGLCIATISVGRALAPDNVDQLILIAMGIGAVLVIWQFIAAGKRFMRKEVLPTLAKSLAPLKPSEQEIDLALRDFRKAGHQIGSRLKATEILEAMH
jgi:hypothetical protein